jgi:hypothetical protein
MSAHIKQLAQKILNLQAKEHSPADEELFQTLVELGDQAQTLVRLCTPTEPGPDNVEGNLAVFSYWIAADSGYTAEATYAGITPAQYTNVVGALNGNLKLVTPEIEEQLARLSGLDK